MKKTLLLIMLTLLVIPLVSANWWDDFINSFTLGAMASNNLDYLKGKCSSYPSAKIWSTTKSGCSVYCIDTSSSTCQSAYSTCNYVTKVYDCGTTTPLPTPTPITPTTTDYCVGLNANEKYSIGTIRCYSGDLTPLKKCSGQNQWTAIGKCSDFGNYVGCKGNNVYGTSYSDVCTTCKNHLETCSLDSDCCSGYLCKVITSNGVKKCIKKESITLYSFCEDLTCASCWSEDKRTCVGYAPVLGSVIEPTSPTPCTFIGKNDNLNSYFYLDLLTCKIEAGKYIKCEEGYQIVNNKCVKIVEPTPTPPITPTPTPLLEGCLEGQVCCWIYHGWGSEDDEYKCALPKDCIYTIFKQEQISDPDIIKLKCGGTTPLPTPTPSPTISPSITPTITPPIACIDKESTFYSDGEFTMITKSLIGRDKSFSGSAEDNIDVFKSVIPFTSQKYFIDKNDACCEDFVPQFSDEKSGHLTEQSYSGWNILTGTLMGLATGNPALVIGGAVLGLIVKDVETIDYSYNVYICKTKGDGFCPDFIVKIGNTFSKDNACAIGWIAIVLAIIIGFALISRMIGGK